MILESSSFSFANLSASRLIDSSTVGDGCLTAMVAMVSNNSTTVITSWVSHVIE